MSVKASLEKLLGNTDPLFINGVAETWPDMALDFNSDGRERLNGNGLRLGRHQLVFISVDHNHWWTAADLFGGKVCANQPARITHHARNRLLRQGAVNRDIMVP